jgi:hypothetical protein
VVFVVEALFDGLDQAADDLLKTVQGSGPDRFRRRCGSGI